VAHPQPLHAVADRRERRCDLGVARPRRVKCRRAPLELRVAPPAARLTGAAATVAVFMIALIPVFSLARRSRARSLVL